MDKKITVGIIGVGSISECHISAYKNNPNVELYAFCDINPNTLKLKGETHGITRLYTDINEFLALEEMDAVSVCTWNNGHNPCAIAALKAGKHVLCEKPMALSKEQAEEMKKVADESGKLLMIGFVRRSSNETIVAKDFIDKGYLGDIYYAKATYLRRHGNPGGWFGDKSRSGGGPLIDLGVHAIDQIRYLMGNPKPVSVYGVTFSKLLNRPHLKDKPGYVSVDAKDGETCDVEDLANALIRFDNGAVLSIEVSFSLNTKESEHKTTELFGTKGGMSFTPSLEIYTETNDYLTNLSFHKSQPSSFNSDFNMEINNFVDCIQGKKECIAPAQDGIDIMAILDAIYESAKTGHEIIL